MTAEDPHYLATLEVTERDLRRGSVMLRYSAPDDFGPPVTAFNICTFWLIEALHRTGRKRRAHCLAKCLNVARRPGCFPKISTQLPGNCGGITLKPIHWWVSSTAQSCSASLGANVDEPPDRDIEPSSSDRQWRGARRTRRSAIRRPARNTGAPRSAT